MKAKMVGEFSLKSGDGKIDFTGVKGDIYEVTLEDDGRFTFEFTGLDGEPVTVTLPKDTENPIFEVINDSEVTDAR